MLEPTATATVLTTIRDHEPLSRAEIAYRARLSPSVVSTVTRSLIERGVVQEVGTERAAMGRPSILLRVRPEFAYFVGLSLDGVRVTGTLVDLGGAVLADADERLRDRAPASVVDACASLTARLLDRPEAAIDPASVASIGIALSGLVDAADGTCIQSTVMGWDDVPIGPMLERRLERPVVAANDADAVAVGERLYGTATGFDDVAVLSIGQGIGAGIVASGRLFQGTHGAAGELGHCTIELDGPPCRCGKRGCLEAIASVPALMERARARGVDAPDMEALEAEAATGDPVATEELERAGSAIGLALSHLVNLFSPALLIVTGSGTKLGPVLRSAAHERYVQNVIPMLPSPPELRFRHEDGAVWARGAAAFATESFLVKGGVMDDR